jgi:hypothetical protein
MGIYSNGNVMKKITFSEACSIFNKLQTNQEKQVLQERNFKEKRPRQNIIN